jgi:hypothetical protein
MPLQWPGIARQAEEESFSIFSDGRSQFERTMVFVKSSSGLSKVD